MIPRRFFWLFDSVGLVLAFAAAYLLAPVISSSLEATVPGFWLQVLGATPSPAAPLLSDTAWLLILSGPVVMLALTAVGSHRAILQQTLTRLVLGPVVALIVALGVITLALFALQSAGWSRVFVFLFMVLAMVVLVSYRLVLRAYFLRRMASGYYARNVLVIAGSNGVTWLANYLASPDLGTRYRLIGYLRVNNDPAPVVPGTVVPLGYVDQLPDLLIHQPIHEVVVIQSAGSSPWIESVIESCDLMGCVLRIVPEALLTSERRKLAALYRYDPMRLPAVVLQPPHHDSEALYLKRLIDIALSAALLVLLSPLMLAIAIAIKITTPRLPVLYPWRVVGQNGVEFTGYKFTTMVEDADDRRQDLLQQNEMSGPVFKIRNDPRITPLGRFLRKFSLNELPQLWSVLKGDMSLVGPRPAFRHELERYEFWHKRKLSIKPGITCLWQVRGRNRISNFDDWVRMDLEYIDNWSLWLDIKTMARTAWVVVAGTGS